ncbi:MAG: Na/Pi cotransporter family protein [Clostridia bacterium]|nr:Na/Pi cotransporter family protein [Clostridia bacterium]
MFSLTSVQPVLSAALEDGLKSIVEVTSSEWLKVVIGLIVGLVFFMFGMNVMSGNLEKMSGGKLERTLKTATASPWISIFLGAAITIAVQSSSATTVMLVGLVNSGLMTMSQTLYVIYGANIGTTFTSWILSMSGIESDNIGILMLKPENFAPILALLGTVMVMMSKKDQRKSIGTVLIGFAVLIYGMEMMGDAVKPLSEVQEFRALLLQYDNPLLLLLISTVFTGVIQSSAATIGIVQTFAMTGVITNGMSIPLVMGANIGTCVTSLLSSIGTNRNAKRVVVLHTAMNLIGTLVWLPAFMLFDYLLPDTGAIHTFLNSSEEASAFAVAVCHSVFNVLTAALLLPMGKWMEKLAHLVVRDKEDEPVQKGTFLDERLLNSPSVAVSESNVATVGMCALAHINVVRAINLFAQYDENVVEEIRAAEKRLDADEDKLGTYLVQLSSRSLSEKDSQVVSKMLHAIGNFERLGDHALNLTGSAKEMHEKGLSFTDEAKAELGVLVAAIREILDITDRAYSDNDPVLAAQVEPLEQVIDDLIAKIRSNHIRRLRKGGCSIEMGFVLSDALTNFERVSDHCSNVAVAIIETEHNAYDIHNYLHGIKHGNEEFIQSFQEYSNKYSLA